MRAWASTSVIFFSLFAFGDGKFDSSILKTAPAPVETHAPQAGNKPGKSTFKPQTTEDLGDEKLALERLKAIDTLLTKEKNADRRKKLLFNKGILYLQYARVLRLKAKNSDAITAEEQNAIKNTIQGMGEITRDPHINAKDKSYANYITGMAYTSSGQDDQAIPFMIKSIDLYPDAHYLVGVALFLGEYYFDHEKYELAINYYKKFYTRMQPKEKALAKYKTAWAYWNLHDLDKTQALFIELIHDKSAGEFGVDANKDLAYVMTQHKSEEEILAYSESIFGKDDKNRLIFLTSAYLTMRRQKHTEGIQKIFQTLLHLEKIPSKKINLWIDEIRNNKFEYASAPQYTIFEKMRNVFLAMSNRDKEEVLKNAGDDMDTETQSLVRSFIDTYSGRVKNIENIDKGKMALALENLFVFHDTYFPKSKVKVAINQLWLELCIDQKNLKCVYDVSNKIIADPDLKPIHERANVELITAVDELFRQDENKYRSDYVSILEKYIKNQNAPRWVEASKRLSAIYLNTKQYDKAIPLLQKINDREKSEESYYRLQLGRFDAQKFRDVADAVPPSGVKLSEKTNELAREASLKLAIESEKDVNGFSAYEANIEKFLSLNTNQEKSVIVLRDYLNHLIERKEFAKATARFLKVNAEMRDDANFRPIAHVLGVQNLKEGQFDNAETLLTFKKNPSQFRYERFTAELGKGAEPTPQDLDSFDAEKKNYILGVLVLTQPKVVIRYVKSKKWLPPEEKKIALLALQIEQGEKFVSADGDLKKLLGKDMPVKEDVDYRLEVEKFMEGIRVPKKSDPSPEFAKKLQKIMKRIRTARPEVVRQIKGKPSAVQLRALTEAKTLEQSVADLVLDSPVPDNLTPAQVTEYKTGLQGLAKEFVDQASDFDKTIQALQSQEAAAKQAQDEQSMPPFNRDKWPWPTTDPAKNVIALVKKKNFTGAILTLDLLKSAGDITESDFYKLRSGVLMMGHGNSIMADYVRRELLDAKQDVLIEEWKKQK